MTSSPAPRPTAAAPPPPQGARGQVVLVTGLSGAGRTLTLKSLEDLGYEAVDNLPMSLLRNLVRPRRAVARPLAVGIDIRSRDFGPQPVQAVLRRLLEDDEVDARLLFVDCDDETLRQRFSETRRRHPLAADRPLGDGIRHERALMAPLRALADLVLDTSDMSPADLRRVVTGHFGLENRAPMVVFVTSFGYSAGLPREADLVFDVRFLTNPHYDPALRPLTGRDAAVSEHVERDPDFAGFVQSVTGLLDRLLPRFAAEGKSYLTIAVGCTGGRHRSVVVAERLAAHLRAAGVPVDLRHRDLPGGVEGEGAAS